MNKLLFILLASLCVHSVAFSQRYSIKGKVTDEEGLGIPGVTVVVKGTQTGTSTDVDGNYTVNIPESSQILVFSFIGMGTEERAIENQRVINVIMRTESLSIDEIIVVGYGQQKKLSSVASISQVKGDDLKEISGVTNLSEQMQGIMPGVTVINTSSKPGDAFNTDVFIRGKASWRSSYSR